MNDREKAKYLELMGTRLIRNAERRGNNPRWHNTGPLRRFANDIRKRRPASEGWFRKYLVRHIGGKRCEWNYPFRLFIIDYAYTVPRIAIEIDDVGHRKPDMKVRDTLKTQYLELEGWRVFRVPFGDEAAAKAVHKILCDTKAEYIGCSARKKSHATS